MPRCKRCAKLFKDNSRVLAHMNHPHSSCHTHFQDVVHIAELLQSTQDDAAQTQARSSSPSPLPTPSPEDDPMLSGDLNHDILDIPMDEDSDTPQPFFLEHHPFPSRTYGPGQTLMDQFDQDKHADKRAQNLYYPFASRKEWEVASFLLRSSLSMANINKFLKLEMVGLITSHHFTDP